MTKRDKSVLVWGGIVFVAILVGGFALAGTYFKEAFSEIGFSRKILLFMGFVACDFLGYVAAYFIGYKFAFWLKPTAVITRDSNFKLHQLMWDVIGYLFIYLAAMVGVVLLIAKIFM
ncbi:MAG: hypothetical protein IJ558_11570 [Treponema sp.]|nr:hypothetical protein [Treponema sp.]